MTGGVLSYTGERADEKKEVERGIRTTRPRTGIATFAPSTTVGVTDPTNPSISSISSTTSTSPGDGPWRSTTGQKQTLFGMGWEKEREPPMGFWGLDDSPSMGGDNRAGLDLNDVADLHWDDVASLDLDDGTAAMTAVSQS